GRTWVVEDVADGTIPAAERDYCLAHGVAAWVDVPLVKGGQLQAALFLVQDAPRRWNATEIALAEETAERTWAEVERGRAEAALRESEERFAQFANASASALWIRDAETLAMEYASPAMHNIYGIAPDALLGPVERWAALITPDDRDGALEHMETARQGEAVVHEFRIQRPSDKAFRWVRDTDFPLQNNGHVHRIGGIAEDVTEAKLLAEHQTVLLLELQHRVRNILAVIRSITARTGERATSVADYAELIAGRLLALARVQALLTRAANVSVGVATIVHDEVSAQATHEGQYVLEGPDLELSPKAAEILTLALHELATNAVKYGALAVPNGKVTVRWETFEKRERTWLALNWREEGAPERPPPTDDKPRRRGFGSELIEGRIPYELGGRGKVTIEPGGAQCHLEFPLKEGASVLETGAPQRTTVFGGALDMSGEADLSGHRVLVVEDDFYLATDAARALEGAGAEVIGPCPDEASARAEIEERRPDAVLLDINLGTGPSFKLAEALKDKGIPFVFTTGYDPEAIPAEFDHIERLQKPMPLRQIVGAIATLVGKAA
ncbi:MAG TPA: HWE histidine kinase domain-containing protein, partial [Gemmatimonadaceae bacterium]|nr:HWE histidine kinase domain-containing protein [Gemmatimonadaceae bacterium]